MLDAGDPYVELIIRFICAGRPAGTLTLGANPGHYRWGSKACCMPLPGYKQP